jgi:hypothetical protein
MGFRDDNAADHLSGPFRGESAGTGHRHARGTAMAPADEGLVLGAGDLSDPVACPDCDHRADDLHDPSGRCRSSVQPSARRRADRVRRVLCAIDGRAVHHPAPQPSRLPVVRGWHDPDHVPLGAGRFPVDVRGRTNVSHQAFAPCEDRGRRCRGATDEGAVKN